MTTRAAPRWTTVAERGSLPGIRILVWFYRHFGRPVGLTITHASLVYYYLVSPAARAASRAYLRRVAAAPGGAEALGRRPGAWASFLHFRAFAISIFDRLAIWLGREGELELVAYGREHIDRLLTPECGGIVVGAHLGSFDALRALAVRFGNVVNVVMYTRNAPRINEMIRQLSPDAVVRVIQADQSVDSVHQIRACVKRGELVALLGDRIEPNNRGRTCRVHILGGPVEIPQAPYLLAGLLECPLFLMLAVRGDDGCYRAYAEVLSERVVFERADRDKVVRELAAAYAGRLEHYILKAPYQWFNFFDYWNDGG